MYSTVHITVQISPMAQVYSILDVQYCIAGTELVQKVWNLRFQLNVSRLVIMWKSADIAVVSGRVISCKSANIAAMPSKGLCVVVLTDDPRLISC